MTPDDDMRVRPGLRFWTPADAGDGLTSGQLLRWAGMAAAVMLLLAVVFVAQRSEPAAVARVDPSMDVTTPPRAVPQAPAHGEGEAPGLVDESERAPPEVDPSSTPSGPEETQAEAELPEVNPAWTARVPPRKEAETELPEPRVRWRGPKSAKAGQEFYVRVVLYDWPEAVQECAVSFSALLLSCEDVRFEPGPGGEAVDTSVSEIEGTRPGRRYQVTRTVVRWNEAARGGEIELGRVYLRARSEQVGYEPLFFRNRAGNYLMCNGLQVKYVLTTFGLRVE